MPITALKVHLKIILYTLSTVILSGISINTFRGLLVFSGQFSSCPCQYMKLTFHVIANTPPPHIFKYLLVTYTS